MGTPTPAPGSTGAASDPQYQSPQDAVNQRVGATSTMVGKAYAGSMGFANLYGPAAASGMAEVGGGGPKGKYYRRPSYVVATKDLIQSFYDWDQAYKDEFRNKLALTDKGWATASDGQLAERWADYVNQSSSYLQAGQSVSPWDILGKDVQAASGTLAAGPKVTTTVGTQLTGAADAEAIFIQAAQSLLGRAPSKEEIAAFAGALNVRERAAPITTKTTTTTSPTGEETSQVEQTGGFSSSAAAVLASKQAKASGDYAEHQAATTLMDWLVSASGGR